MTALTAALANQGLGAAILDPDGRLRWANAALRQITGFDMTESLGRPLPFRSATAGSPWPPHDVGDQTLPWQGELDCIDARGEALVLQASLSWLPGASDAVPDWLLLCFDISQQLAYTRHSARHFVYKVISRCRANQFWLWLIMRFEEVAVDNLNPLLCKPYKSMRYDGSFRDPQGKIGHLLNSTLAIFAP